jgi:hypothetical protein
MDDTRATLVILLFGAPQVLERAQGGENRATNPDRVLPLRRRDDLDLFTMNSQSVTINIEDDVRIVYLHACRAERRELLLHTISDTGEHGGSSREHDVSVKVTTDIQVALEDRVVPAKRPSARVMMQRGPRSRRLMDTSSFKTKESRLEQSLRSTEPVVGACQPLIRDSITGMPTAHCRS